MSLRAAPVNCHHPLNVGARPRVGLKQRSTQIGDIFNPRDYGLEVFRQGFSGWKTTYPWGSRTHNHFAYMTDANVTFNDSNQSATITAKRVPPSQATGNKSFTSGVISGPSIDVADGDTYIEGEFILPVDPGNNNMAGVWPAFWLNSADGTWPPELDIFENRGDITSGGTLHAVCHFNDNGKDRSQSRRFNLKVDKWFKIGVLIHQDENPSKRYCQFTYDGKKFGALVYDPDINQMKNLHPIINMAIGGAWGGAVPTTWNGATMQARNFKVWKKSSLETILRHNTFRGMIEILNSWSCKYLADYLESLDGKGRAGNNRFGALGLYRISQLPLNDPKWEQAREPIPLQYRQLVKDMAARALGSNYKNLMDQVHNGDGIFENGDMDRWLISNPRKGHLEIERKQYVNFRKAMSSLSKPEGIDMMDFLESPDGKGKDGNKRFGLLGLYRLSKLSLNSPEWSKKGVNDHALRDELINAAVFAMKPVNERYLFAVHNGDGIFEKGDIKNWFGINLL